MLVPQSEKFVLTPAAVATEVAELPFMAADAGL
jgi:hypothetical protein